MKLWEMFHALGEPTRFQVVKAIMACGRPEGISVGDLCQKLNMTMVNMSHHLGVLRNSGVLESTRHGRFIYYTLGKCFMVDEAGAVVRTEDMVIHFLKAVQGNPGG